MSWPLILSVNDDSFVKHEDKIISITKGGPDVIFARCNNLDIDEVSVVNETMSNEALRVLALGIRYWMKNHKNSPVND